MKQHITYQERSLFTLVIDKVFHTFGNQLSSYLFKTLGRDAADFVLYQAINKNYKHLSDLQVSKVLSAFEYIGLCEFGGEHGVKLNTDNIMKFDVTALRKTETNFIRQLELFKIEAKSSPVNEVNDSLYAYKQNYDVYGYLTHTCHELDEFSFLVREFDPIGLPIIHDIERLRVIKRKMMKKIVHFKKMCKKARINTIVLEKKIFHENRELIELLIANGFKRYDFKMIWTDR
jgi:hypothetical protein